MARADAWAFTSFGAKLVKNPDGTNFLGMSLIERWKGAFSMIRTRLIFSVLIIILLTACNTPSEVNPETIRTSAAQTVVAQATEAAINTLAVQLTRQALTPSPTYTPLPSETPTITPTLQYTLTPSLTPTPVTPTVTQTPLPTWTPLSTWTPMATATPLVRCNQIRFISDVTIPDHTVMKPNQVFVKTWRLQNIGACTWTTKYALIFAGNAHMSGPSVATLTTEVRPGGTVDLSVTLKAPDQAGEYTGLWRLMDANGASFGVGASANSSFWVKIKVDPAMAEFFPELTTNFCNAEWSSNAGLLACPSPNYDYTNGSITYSNNPMLEGNIQENEPTLIMVPANGSNGFISGKYPAYTIQTGEHFYALIACINNSLTCSVKFRLNYQEVGSSTVQNLGSWTEINDGLYTKLDIDLAALAGKKVYIILEVQNYNNTSQDDRAAWVAPKIKKP
jgi:hypothetical protein